MSTSIAHKKRRLRSDYIYHQTHRTRWFDNDMYAHLNNTAYAMLFDSIINTYLITHCGMDPFTHNNPTLTTPDPSSSTTTTTTSTPGFKSNQVGIMVSSYCDYFSSVSFPDILDLGLRVTKLGNSSVTYEVGVFKEGEEEVKVVGGYTHVFVARETMRPTREGMEVGVRRGLERLLVSDDTAVGGGGGKGAKL
ncbi:thioesterase family protein [Aspergillus piperis CBS 112811]|uniref:Thioesterase family protein n=1 Tax=Aspergillus piperis CBS 112811 TaxID=1448313 RepID=A0A8G1QTK5_9EURO|nr:thioesterase family protein [Aspergillus piperis CBS 112811]RAH53424.1 thioesterase family protein [Aspergillus piperis CBS 112811]